MPPRVWGFGDKVVHPGKPEWGHGVVTGAQKTTHEGKACQSVTIRFDRAGVKTINTAFANLAEAGSAPSLRGGGAGGRELVSDEPTFEQAAEALVEAKLAGNPKDVMTRLPEPATDPFSTPVQRFKATAGLYRFAPTGGSLLDWAAAQSGLADPMSRFNRHELERFFEQFSVVRDAHLRKVAQEAKRADPAGLAQAITQAPPAAQQAVRRLDALR